VLDFQERASGPDDFVGELDPFHCVDANAGKLRKRKLTKAQKRTGGSYLCSLN
jgi:hypothetical protein